MLNLNSFASRMLPATLVALATSILLVLASMTHAIAATIPQV
jgi:hypothetical protein